MLTGKFLEVIAHYPEKHPRIILGSALLITLVCCAFFLLSFERAVTVHFSSAPPWKQIGMDREPFTTSSQDALIVGLNAAAGEESVFTPAGLRDAAALNRAAHTLSLAAGDRSPLIARDYLSLENSDVVSTPELGTPGLQPLMDNVPENLEQAEQIAQRGLADPFSGTLIIAKNRKATAMVLPLLTDGLTSRIADNLRESAAASGVSGDRIRFGGQPYARETFFREAAEKGILLFAASSLLFFLGASLLFGTPAYGIIPLIPATCATSVMMALQSALHLPADIFTFYIPLSAALVCILLSLFYLTVFHHHRNGEAGNEELLKKTSARFRKETGLPLLTTVIALLLLLPIPVDTLRWFGLLAAAGLAVSWLLTLLTLPALLLRVDAKRRSPLPASLYLKPIKALNRLSSAGGKYPLRFFLFHGALFALAVLPVLLIRCDDDPVRWFSKGHQVAADNRMINVFFAGSYRMELNLVPSEATRIPSTEAADWLKRQLRRPLAVSPPIRIQAYEEIDRAASLHDYGTGMAESLDRKWQEKIRNLPAEAYLDFDLWSHAHDMLSQLRYGGQAFLLPSMVRYLDALQEHIVATGAAGKALSAADVAKSMHSALFENTPTRYSVPPTAAGVAQAFSVFKARRHPEYLDRFINDEATAATIRLHLKDGGTETIDLLLKTVTDYIQQTPPPIGLTVQWTGTAVENRYWFGKSIRFMLLWAAAGIFTAFALPALCSKNVFTALVLAGAVLYTAVIALGVSSVLGLSMTAFGSGVLPFILVQSLFVTWMGIVRAGSSLARTGSLTGTDAAENTQDAVLHLCWIAGCITWLSPTFFSPFALLQNFSVMIINTAFANLLVSTTLLPPVLAALQSRIFNREIKAFTDRQEQSQVKEEDEAAEESSHLIDVASLFKEDTEAEITDSDTTTEKETA